MTTLPTPLRRLAGLLVLGLPFALALGPFPILQVLAVLGLLALLSCLLLLPAAGFGEALTWSVLFRLLAPIAWIMPDPGQWWTALARRSEDTYLIEGALDRGEQWGDPEATLEIALNRLSSGVPGIQQGGLDRVKALAAQGHREALDALAGCMAWGLGIPMDAAGARTLWIRLGGGAETPIPQPRSGLLRKVAARRTQGLEGALAQGLARAGEGTQSLFARSAPARVGLWLLLIGLVLFLLAMPVTMFLGTLFGPLGPALAAFIAPPVAILTWMAISLRRSNRPPARFRRQHQAAESGDPEACFNLGTEFDRGTPQVAKDVSEARRWYRIAAERGHVEAAFRLGELQLIGLGGVKDRAAALAWFQRAADQGHAGAARRLTEAQPAASEDA